MPARRSIKHPCRPDTTPSIRFCANASRPHESSRGARQMSRSMWALNNIGPELTKAFDAAGSRTPRRRVADEQSAGEGVWSGLKQGVEGYAVTSDGMRWCCLRAQAAVPRDRRTPAAGIGYLIDAAISRLPG